VPRKKFENKHALQVRCLADGCWKTCLLTLISVQPSS